MTKHQKLILSLIKEAPRHMTAAEIGERAKEQQPGISVATVYNSLGALCAEGLIRRLHIVGQADRYDRNTEQHQHLVCEGCGAIQDILLDRFAEDLAARIGRPLLSYELNMHYLCPACEVAHQ